MSIVTYDSSEICIRSKKTLAEKIKTIDAMITALESTVLKAVGTANIDEYQLNDGQTIIKTIYRNATDVINSITALEAIRQRYVNQLNGRMIRLVDSKNFTGRRLNGRN